MKSIALLEQVKTQTLQIKKTAEQFFLPLDATAVNKKPSATQWSIAECLEHLNYYSTYYNKEIKAAIQQAKSKNWKTQENFSTTWLGRKSVEMVHPDNQKPIKTKKYLNPSFSKITPDVVQRFIAGQEEFLELIEAAQAIDLNKAKVRIEVMKLFKLPLGDIFLFMVTHHQRHCNQAMRAGGFNKAVAH